MNKKEEFVIQDCVRFKHDLAKKSWEKSGAKTLDEYAKYVNENAKKSPLWLKLKKNNMVN